MRKFSAAIYLSLCLAFSVPLVRGQSGTASVNVTYQTVATGITLPDLFYKPTVTPVENQQQINHAHGRVSEEIYPYAGPASMEFFTREGPPAAPSGSAGTSPAPTIASSRGPNYPLRYKAVGKVAFPKSGAYIVYISSGPNGTVLATAVPRSATDFPAGTFAFINATGLPLEIKATDEKSVPKVATLLPVGQVAVVPVTESLIFRLSRTDKDPVEGIQGFLADPTPRARTSVLLLPDLSISVLSEEAPPAPATVTRPPSPPAGNNPPPRAN